MTTQQQPLNPRLRRNEEKKYPGFDSGLLSASRDRRLLILPPAHLPPPFDKADVSAWKSLNLGTAPAHLQMRAIEHLALITNFNGDPYVPNDAYATAYAAGRRSVMANIHSIITYILEPSERSDGGEQG